VANNLAARIKMQFLRQKGVELELRKGEADVVGKRKEWDEWEKMEGYKG